MQHFVRSSNEYREFWHIGPAQYVEHRSSNPMEMNWDLFYPLPGDLYQGFNRGRIAISPEEERLGTRDLPRQRQGCEPNRRFMHDIHEECSKLLECASSILQIGTLESAFLTTTCSRSKLFSAIGLLALLGRNQLTCLRTSRFGLSRSPQNC